MSLIPYYLQYLSEICEGTRRAPEGIVLTEQEDLKKALQLQAEISRIGIPAFVRACAEADGTEIAQEEYDSFDPAELNAAIAQLASAAQPQPEKAPEEAPQEPVAEAAEVPEVPEPAEDEDFDPDQRDLDALLASVNAVIDPAPKDEAAPKEETAAPAEGKETDDTPAEPSHDYVDTDEEDDEDEPELEPEESDLTNV